MGRLRSSIKEHHLHIISTKKQPTSWEQFDVNENLHTIEKDHVDHPPFFQLDNKYTKIPSNTLLG